MNIWGWNEYFISRNPGMVGPNSVVYDDTSTKVVVTGEEQTGSGQTPVVTNKGQEKDTSPPSLLKPLLFAAGAVAAFTLLT